jgi:hypothetical protein
VVLHQFGNRVESGCSSLPDTCEKIDQTLLETLSCSRCEVKVAVLASGRHVAAQSGPTNTRLRAFLGKTDSYRKMKNRKRGKWILRGQGKQAVVWSERERGIESRHIHMTVGRAE